MPGLTSFLFHGKAAGEHPRLLRAWTAAVYLWGAWLWGCFYNWGRFPVDFHDWAEITAARLSYLRDAALLGVLPLHASETAHLRNVTDRLMSIPDMVLSPQVILMRWMDTGMFVLVNTLLLYSLAFAGLLWFRRRYALSPVVFALLVMLFNFNGHLVSHFAIGHITWWGYFLLPWFFVQLIRLLEDGEHSWRWVAQTSGVLFLIFIQGGYHHYVWCLVFLGVLALADWKHFWAILKVLVFANLLSMVRLLPPALLLGQFDTDFYGGYRLPWHVLSAMAIERLPQDAVPFANFNSSLGWWEFDLYIGIAGLLVVGIGFILWLVGLKKDRRTLALLAPMLILTLLAIRAWYQPFTALPIPLLNGERVTSRFLIMPLLAVLFLGLPVLQTWLDRRPQPAWVYTLFCLAGALVVWDLSRHVLSWQVAKVAPNFPVTPVNLAIKVLANHADPPYFWMLGIGAGVSLITGAVLVLLVRWEKRKL